MKSIGTKPATGLLGVLLFALASGGAAFAQNTAPTESGADSMGAVHGNPSHADRMHEDVMGMHAMPATVNAVDPRSGLVGVDAAGMALQVHFPPPAAAQLKAGDRITLHMGYTKP